MAKKKSLAGMVVGAMGGALVDKRLPVLRRLAVVTGFAASGARLALGTFVGPLGKRPEHPLILYEFDGCPYCRKVREAMSILDLDAHIKPCPKKGTRFRSELLARGGRAQFPYLIDPNNPDSEAGRGMYESSAIVRYLFATYGTRAAPAFLLAEPATIVTGAMCSVLLGTRGSYAKASRAPDLPLELYGYEASPFSRFARQALCELEIPYLLHNVARKSPRRKAFVEKSGRMQVPFLVDPNTQKTMFESYEIERYLRTTYGSVSQKAAQH